MPVPRYINDGSFLVAVQQGAIKWNYPFFEKGDSTSFEALITYWQDQSTYKREAVGTTKTITQPTIGSATCYNVSESNAQDRGNGLLEFTRTYASLPITRTEGGLLVWGMLPETQQFLSGAFGIINLIYEIYKDVRTWPVSWIYEYFTSIPAAIVVPRSNLIGPFYYTITTPLSVQSSGINTIIAAQDSTVDIYKGTIYVRKTPFITLPPPSSFPHA